MQVNILVYKTDGRHTYKAVIDTADYRQVMNEIRKGRGVIGNPNVTTVGLECDKTPFRVGSEKDTSEWLKRRFEAEKMKQKEQV
jgi:hypothetical protein